MQPDDTRDYARLFLEATPLLDLRAPAEFARGAFPGAVNLPLLNDEERHQVGLRYRERGQEAAIALGHELVSGTRRERRMHGWLDWCRRHPQGYIYCFRGGLRSQTVRAWLAEAGRPMPLVEGGYKAMRRFLLESVETSLARLEPILLCGRTGAGKTRVIAALDNAVDLEGHARHRGSAFGRRPGGQPAQIDFENALAIDLLRLAASDAATVVLEDESKLIGRCLLPPSLQEQMRLAPRVMIEEPLESRVEVTLEDYVIGPLEEYAREHGERTALERLGEELLAALERIRKRLGGARYTALRERMAAALAHQRASGETAQHRDWIRTLLAEYYDPSYDHMMGRHTSEILFTGSRAAVAEYLAQASRQHRALHVG